MSESTSSREHATLDASTPALGGGAVVGRGERRTVLLIILLVFLVNLVTASRSPTVWKDEVMFVDPAVNWVQGNGFVSTAWPGQSSRTIWASNAPLHTILLCPWFKLFGVSPTSARAINFVYISGAAYLLWLAAARARWLKTPRSRVFLVLLVLLANGVSFAYRSGRYDAIGILLLAATCFFATVRNTRTRIAALTLAGILVPWTGLQLVIYLALMGAVLLGCVGFKSLRITLPLGIGVIIGSGSFAGSLYLIGRWQDFSTYVSGSQASPLTGQAPATSHAARTLRGVAEILETRDYSLILIAMLLVLGLVLRRGLPRRIVALGFATAVVVPVGLAVVYSFAAYYTWSVFVPLSIVVLALWERGSPRFRAPAALMGAGHGAFLCLVMLVGLPARIGVTISEWNWRDHRRVVDLAGASVTSKDIAVISPEAYYPVKSLAGQTYLTHYLYRLTPEEKASISVLVLAEDLDVRKSGQEDDVALALRVLGDGWHKVAAMAPPAPPGSPSIRHYYNLVVLRRDGVATFTAPH